MNCGILSDTMIAIGAVLITMTACDAWNTEAPGDTDD